MPPGNWMLFLISDTGVPSVGTYIRVTLPCRQYRFDGVHELQIAYK